MYRINVYFLIRGPLKDDMYRYGLPEENFEGEDGYSPRQAVYLGDEYSSPKASSRPLGQCSGGGEDPEARCPASGDEEG